MKLVIAATPNVAIPSIEFLSTQHQVTIITQPDRAAGRGKKLRATEIAQRFPAALKPEGDREFGAILQECDLLITIGYGRILSQEILEIPKFGGINLHFSLLPKWRGAAPVQRCIEAGEKITGVTVFQMDSGVDTGAIWSQLQFQIPVGFNTTQLFSELSNLGREALVIAIEKIIKGESPKPQSGEATSARKIHKEECVIDWRESSENIIRKIRAFGANPGVHSKIRGEQLLIEEAQISDRKLNIGELAPTGEVGTGDGSVKLIMVTPAGKRTMLVRDWLNGFKPQVGERFE